MKLRLLIDMNLSVDWVTALEAAGYEAVHWSTVGDPRADDTTLMAWARSEGCIVFTHDLDFGTALALTHAEGPSVLQIRGSQVLPEDVLEIVVTVLHRYSNELLGGALVVIEKSRSRVRVLPL